MTHWIVDNLALTPVESLSLYQQEMMALNICTFIMLMVFGVFK